MLNQLTKRLSTISTRAAIAGVLIVVVVISGVALLLTRGRSEANADSAMQPRAARLERVDGSVGIARAETEHKQLDWAEATINTPVTVGDRIYARNKAHASIALTGHDYVRLNPITSLDVLALEERRTQLALRSGSALFDVGEFAPDEFYEVATPCGAVDFKEPGLYQVGIEGGNAIISVLSGLAQVVGQEGSGYISKGRVFTLVGATAAQVLASRLAPRDAGYIVDDYYRYRYPNIYDGRYQRYDAYLDDPFYYDPYRNSVSSRYLQSDIPGLYELDSYGDWVDVSDYGHCWAPRVSSGWAPFRSGYWDLDDLWGPSWVSSEPWGWAPYHYGRWAFVNQRWLWVPVEVRTRLAYSPAPVAFIPLADQIAWVPLAPNEVYVPRYYDVNYRPQYLAPVEVINLVTVQRTFANFNAPGAVTVVPVRALTRVIGPGVITTVDPRVVANSRAVLDPFSVGGVRDLAISRQDARRRIKLERREQEAFNTPVVAGSIPDVSPVQTRIGRAFRVEAVPEKQKQNKLKINDAAEVASSRSRDGLPQSQAQSQVRDPRMAAFAVRAEQGDKAARREMRQLMRQEQTAQQQQQAAQQQAQQEQSRQQMKEQRRGERQRAAAATQQEAARQQQQMKPQRRAERQQQSAVAVQQEAARQAQQQQMKEQRRAERQQQQEQMRQEEQMRQQRKEQKRKPPEASVQQQQLRQAQQEAARQAQVSQQRRQLKAQTHAEQQQRAMIEQQHRRAPMQAAQQAQAGEQMKAQRHAEQRQGIIQQQQEARARAAQQPAAAQPQRAPASAGENRTQPKAEKAQRKYPQ